MATKKIKVVHVSTHIDGGAGLAALRLHNALSGMVESTFLTLDQSNFKGVSTLKFERSPFLSRIINKFLRYIWPKKNRYADLISQFKELYPKLHCSFASLPFSHWNILDHPAVKEADIIHLHWITGMLDYPSFFKTNKKIVFWTMHDMNPIKGIYHYHNDELLNSDYDYFNKKVYDIKQECIAHSNAPLYYISPSLWLQREIAGSPAFRHYTGYNIFNCIDPGFFSVEDQIDREKTDGITELLFVATALSEKRKGIDILFDALGKIDHSTINLTIVGDINYQANKAYSIRSVGRITDAEKLAAVYRSADVFLLPSREDNLPNVMLEALSCGTPVICFNTGGMAQIIIDNVNGMKVPQMDADSLASTIIAFIANKKVFNRSSIRKAAKNMFHPDVIGRSYCDKYTQAISQNLPN